MTFVSYDFGVGDSRYEIGDSCYEVGDTCFWEKKFIIIFFNIKSTKKKYCNKTQLPMQSTITQTSGLPMLRTDFVICKCVNIGL